MNLYRSFEIVIKTLEIENIITVDPNDWPHLAKQLEELKKGQFKNLAIGGEAARRVRRISSYFGPGNDLLRAQKRLDHAV